MKRGKPERLNADIVASFIGAAEKRPAEVRLQQVDKFLKLRNPVRWWRMKRDFRWARKQLAKSGYDPENVRWLL